MQIKTILNRIQKHRGFVYGPTGLRGEGDFTLLAYAFVRATKPVLVPRSAVASQRSCRVCQ